MKLVLVIAICFAVWVSFRTGAYLEGQRIIATCKDENAVTVIQGEKFVCLTEDMVREMRKHSRDRGA